MMNRLIAFLLLAGCAEQAWSDGYDLAGASECDPDVLRWAINTGNASGAPEAFGQGFFDHCDEAEAQHRRR